MSINHTLKKKKNENIRSWGKWILYTVTTLPWIWLICFGIFVLFAVYELGYIPTPYNPDPKDITSGRFFYSMTMILLPLLWWPSVFLHLVVPMSYRARVKDRFSLIAIQMIGFALSVVVLRSDLGIWLMD